MFFFSTVKGVLDDAIASFVQTSGMARAQVHSEIANHIQNTSKEYRRLEPDIEYENGLCRLGYLYVNAGINAHLFERVVRLCPELRTCIDGCAGRPLRISAVGGGPGTEMLGLTRYLTDGAPGAPSRIDFSVLDRIPQWAETWNQLASKCELHMQSEGVSTVLAPSFHPMDVVDPSSYNQYRWLFNQADLIVYNYLLSENKVQLGGGSVAAALTTIVSQARSGATFVIIDRLEHPDGIRSPTKTMLQNLGLGIVADGDLGGCIPDAADDLEPYVTLLGRRPRRWYRTEHARKPTAFFLVAVKP